MSPPPSRRSPPCRCSCPPAARRLGPRAPALVQGRFEGGLASFGLAEDGIGYVSEGPHAAGIPDATRARVDALASRISRGELEVPSR